MSKPKSLGTLDMRKFAGVGDQPADQAQCAVRTVPMYGIGGDPVSGTAGNGAAGAALGIAALRGRDCLVSASGITFFRLDANPTAAAWHFCVIPGTPFPLHVPKTVTDIRGWGVGGAWAFNVVPVDQET